MSIHVHSEFRIEELLNSTNFKSVPDIVFNCLTICIQDLWLLFILNNDLQQWVFIFCLLVNTRSDLVYLSWSFHLLLDPGYRVSPASHTKCSVWAGTWYRWLFSWSFHLLMDPVYRVSPASRTKCSVSAGTWYRWLFSWSFHLLMDPVYRVSPASLTECSVTAGTWYR